MKQNGIFLRHGPCPECGGTDPLAIYQKADGTIDSTCFSCGTYFPPEKTDQTAQIRRKPVNMDFSFIDELTSRGWRERRVSLPVSEFYGVKSKMQGEKCLKRYYPSTINGEVVGYKTRDCVQKGEFPSVGINGKHCEFFGQAKFPANGKFLVITEGEEDCLSAYQMLSNDKYRTPCVSVSVGAQGAAEQIKANYKWVSSFETVVLCFDSDEPGQKAAEECARVLKPGQAKVMKLRLKDANEYLMARQEKEFIESFWRAERYSPAGIVGSSNTWDALVQRAKFVKIPLPAFAERLEKMLNGGIALGEITTIAGASGQGKSSITYEFLYHWIFNSEYRVGIISLESDLGELTENLLSLHIGRKLGTMPDERKLDFYSTQEARDAHRELTTLPDGSDRFIILDHQGDMLDDDLHGKMEYLVKVNGCKVTILDPMTLALAGRGIGDTQEFMSWLVSFVKRENVAHVNVVHVRKAQGGQKAGSAGGTIHEEDMIGCLDRDTEFLSPDGWVKIADWNGEKVAQWYNGVMTYVEPNKFINLECNEGFYHFKNTNNVDMMLSKEHRMLLEIKGRLQVKTPKEIMSAVRIPRAYIPSTWMSFDGLDLSDEIIRVMVMCAADGHYHGNGLCKLEVKKERKVERVYKLLEDANIAFSTTPTKKGSRVFRFKALTESKELDKCADWYSASTHQLQVLAEECIHWDGSDAGNKGRYFSTSKKEEANIVQFAAHSSGLVSRINITERELNGVTKHQYAVSIGRPDSFKNKVMLRENFPVTMVDSPDGRKYCFEVDSGFFIARRNGKIFVTGNSSSIFQNSMNNILIMRDKENDDPTVRNTTKVVMSKSRRTGNTGPAGFWFYNNETSRMEKGRDPHGSYEEDEQTFVDIGATEIVEEEF